MEGKSNEKNKFFLLPIIAIILELLPWGAGLVFSPQPSGRARETFSYFSLTPFSYGNFAPFITAVLSCFILAFVPFVIKKSGAKKVAFTVSLIAVIVSLFPLINGVEYYSIVGCLITIAHVAECILLSIQR